MSTFGNGSPGATWWNWNGASFCWTHWVGGSYGTGAKGRITAIAAYWNAHSGSTTGHNDIWDINSPYNRVQLTGDYSAGVSGHGNWHNVACGDIWQSAASYYIGFWRTASQTDDEYVGGGGAYSGKSADDGNINGGGACGTSGSNNQNIAAYGTTTDTQLYVRRSGGWTQAFAAPFRTGSFTGPQYVYVRRGAGWTIVNEYLQKGERRIPRVGMPGLLCSAGPWGGPECPFCEPCWIVEDGRKSWFGSLDVSKLHISWDRVGHYEVPKARMDAAFASPRRQSHQTSQEVEWLAQELDRRNRSLKDGHDPDAVLAAWSGSVEAAKIEGLRHRLRWSELQPFSSRFQVAPAASPT